jgi:heme/copper-type cytochrome/quinol oxidase subunit 3
VSHTAAADLDTQTYTGQSSRKLLMWAFIGSECMLFGTLIVTYLVMHGRSVVGPYPDELLNIPFITVTTFILLMSSLTMVLALDAVQRDNMKLGRVWLLATAVLGSMFLAGQFLEFSHFYHEGLGLSTNLFGSSFYLLTGTHGAHVTVGVVWLMTLFFMASRGKLSEENSLTVEIAGLYWHFVDVVWIVLFTLIYLLG